MRRISHGRRFLLYTATTVVALVAAASMRAGIAFTSLFSFGSGYSNTDGLNPTTGLVQARDGSFYGVTPNGGTAGYGMVFKITTNGAYTPLVSFAVNNGANPAAVLVQPAGGNFYGTTTAGGTYDLGTVFKLTPAGALTTLTTFNGTNGANPAAGLVLGTNGVLYGTTQYGGANDLDTGGDGTVFKITTNGVLTTLYSFTNSNDGANPVAALIQATDGNFYGTTPYGGVDSSGTVFKMTPAGMLTTLYTFTGGLDGGVLDAGLVQGKDGNFYGTTAYGGTNDVPDGGDGTVFKMTALGALTTLISFNVTNGYDPETGLTQGPDGVLYGTTADGGLNSDGTAFAVTTNGVFTSLISFNGIDGAQPQAKLALGTDGALYGTTEGSGVGNIQGGFGTIFKLTTNSLLSTLYLFGDNKSNGASPVARLAVGPNGYFYSTTVYGGTNHGNYGTVLRIATNGTRSTLASFNGTNGAYPEAALVLGADGAFYGTTAYGGTNHTGNGGDGTVFRITTNGVLTSLASFNFTNGANPAADLALGPDGNFYGTARNGGTNNLANGGNGTVFRVTANGGLTPLVSFNGANGANPATALALGPDGNFYGTTAYGGTNDLANGGDGTVFRLTTNGDLTPLMSFNGTNGANPAGTLVLGASGSFYGTTFTGGTNGSGTVFTITTNGVLTTLHSFTGDFDGGSPAAGLVLGSDGNFYGTTSGGGAYFYGVAFQITPDGTLTVLHSFTGIDGANPLAGLVEGAANHFYGTTEGGGMNDLGTLFHLFIDPFPSIITPPAGLTEFAGRTAVFKVSALGAAPLNYRWQRAATNLSDQGNISGSGTSALTLSNISLPDAAPYRVIVSNVLGAVTSAPASLTVLNPSAPAVATVPATKIGANNATFNGLVVANGALTMVWFQWGLTTNYGNSTAAINIGSGGAWVPASVAVTGLLPFSVYHFSAVAANALGTNAGVDVAFVTPGVRSNVAFTPLVSFNSTNGAGPQAGLLAGGGTNLYGTTYYGGVYDSGTVFRLAPNGALTTLLSFNGTNGSHPAAALAQAANGVLYGTTFDGGLNDVAIGGDGTVFKITTNGVFVRLVSFNGINGQYPAGGLALGPDGRFYGTTENGGTFDVASGGDGTIFRATTNGVLTSLFSFNGTNGAYPAAGLAPGANGSFYGTTSAGGADDSGTVFKITTNGAFVSLFSFTGGDDGADPEASLVQGTDGCFYGTTFSGGMDGFGTVFRITTNGLLTSLYSFNGDVDGAYPSGPLVQGGDGNFYGTTSSGGANGYGTVFLITPAGALASLVLFDSDLFGAGPQAGLALAADGSFYGTASAGGANDLGTVFRFRIAPFPTILVDPTSRTNFVGTAVSFNVAATGSAPLTYHWRRGATNLTDTGNLQGSATSSLTISNLALADADSYSLVVSNSSGSTTSAVALLTVVNPFPPAVTTEPSTANSISRATLNASVNPDGAPTTLWFQFGTTTNYGNSSAATNVGSGGIPVPASVKVSGLAPFTWYHFSALAGNAQGTNAGSDLTFLTPGGRGELSLTTLVSFTFINNNGARPEAGLVQGADGAFYGTTFAGGNNALGTLFKVTADGSLTTLLSFAGTNGSLPAGELMQGADGRLYGTTYGGGTNAVFGGGDGTVFAVTTNGVMSWSVSFNGANGANPLAGLVPGSDGMLYGTTFNGGTNGSTRNGDGTIFRIATDGTLNNLASFNGINGANPAARLALGADGNFYGTTENGGTNNLAGGGLGTVFKISADGLLTSLFSFNGTNGARPVGGLLAGPDGCFFGTTESGGAHDLPNGGDGTVFKISTNGTLTTLYSFTGGIGGANPQAGLVLATDGNFYGTTSAGGFGDRGTAFQLTPGGVLTTLILFDFDVYGAFPSDALIQGADGNLYGVAGDGGVYSSGTVFRFSLPPAPLAFQVPVQTGATLTLTWSATKGATYQLQYRTNLSQTDWINLASVLATNSTASASDTVVSSASRFYRVVLLH